MNHNDNSPFGPDPDPHFDYTDNWYVRLRWQFARLWKWLWHWVPVPTEYEDNHE
jgi:hypothetical protein